MYSRKNNLGQIYVLNKNFKVSTLIWYLKLQKKTEELREDHSLAMAIQQHWSLWPLLISLQN